MKITGGALRPKDTVALNTGHGETITEKIEEIRLYSGDKYKSLACCSAGSVVAVTGLSASRVGGKAAAKGRRLWRRKMRFCASAAKPPHKSALPDSDSFI